MKFLQLVFLVITLACFLFSGELAADDLIHIVQRGETIFSLSRFYQVASDDLMRANGITDPSRLRVSQRLVIPVSDTPSSPVQVNAPAASITLTDYRVVRGDTLFSIARSHGITLHRLQEINRFSPDHSLRAGDVIKVPAPHAPSVTIVNPPSAGGNTGAAGTRASSGLYAMRWPIHPKEISYMTGQMGVVVEGDRLEIVRSLTQGNVVSAGPWRKFGRVVIVETSGGYYYMYGGCESISVNVGDRITPGMELGRLGVNAVSEKPQLFFMVFRNEVPIDPASAPRAGIAGSGNNSRS